MPLQDIYVLLPCHSLEDFPYYLPDTEGSDLLANWTAAWHPALVQAAGAMPTWYRADEPPEGREGGLYFVPGASEAILPSGWIGQTESAGALVVRGHSTRAAAARAAVGKCGVKSDEGDRDERQTLVADFFALGYCYLQLELLTRQMRYHSNLDETAFRGHVIGAASAWHEDDFAATRERLADACDALTEARERFYPVECYLIDLTLVATTTMGAALRSEFDDAVAKSVLVTGDDLLQMEEREPESLAQLRRGIEDGRVALVGGERRESPVPLRSVDAFAASIESSKAIYESLTGKTPQVYGRRSFGLSPMMPQVLDRNGVIGALHFTLDDGSFPQGEQAKTRWEGLDGSAIDALSVKPLDGNDGSSFLRFAETMGSSMDRDHVATVVFAHWPGQRHEHLNDLRRMATYGNPLGRFVDLAEYFEYTDSAGRISRFAVDQYRCPYLRQAIIRNEANPISRHVNYRRLREAAVHADNLTAVSMVLGAAPRSATDSLVQKVDGTIDVDANDVESLRDEIAERKQTAASSIAHLVVGSKHSTAKNAASVGEFIVNASSSPRNVNGTTIPPLGFSAAAALGKPANTRRRRGRKRDGEFPRLQNEQMQVDVDPRTGGIHSIFTGRARGNRLSQQLAVRYRNAGSVEYSRMVADTVSSEIGSSGSGRIRSQGRLVDHEDATMATYEQAVQLDAENGFVTIDFAVALTVELRPDPWNSYLAARFAWPRDDAELFRDVGGCRQPTQKSRFEAPQYIEICDGDVRTTILSGGYPYHQRCGARMLDTLLVVAGEQRMAGQLGVGVDDRYPLRAATAILDDSLVRVDIPVDDGPGVHGWLFHWTAKNVMSVGWECIVEDGAVVGFRVRLLETEGRAVRLQFEAFQEIGAARQVDGDDRTLLDLRVEDGRISVDMSKFELATIDARWAKTTS